MTVAELRAALVDMPGDAEVLTQAGTCGVDEVELSSDHRSCCLD